jgi:UDP-N-acetylmuramate dehydrogenase
MECQQAASLREWNTFRVPARAAYRIRCTHPEELSALPERVPLAELPLLVLGAGSNVLFVGDFPGIVVRLEFSGIHCLEHDAETVCVEVAAGHPWHSFVEFCLRQGWYGLENLALIPGTVGAAPVHNIGAYGVEVAQWLEGVRIWDVQHHCFRWLTAAELELGYRQSALRTRWLGRCIVTHVRFRLRRHPSPRWDYPELAAFLRSQGITAPTPHDVFHAVCTLRRRKLPEPERFPNAGSFFKNPRLPRAHAEELRRRYPSMPFFPGNDGMVKIPAGWLLESCGWRGKREGNVGTWAHHALVVVNYGNATGEEILRFASRLWHSVWERFGIALEPEVLIVPAQAWSPGYASTPGDAPNSGESPPMAAL